MKDAEGTVVVEAESEVEARIYEGLIGEAGIPVQVRPVADPLLINVIRQLVPSRYQVMVPTAAASQAHRIVALHRREMEQIAPVEEEEPAPPDPNKQALLLAGRLLIWLLLLIPLLAVLILVLTRR